MMAAFPSTRCQMLELQTLEYDVLKSPWGVILVRVMLHTHIPVQDEMLVTTTAAKEWETEIAGQVSTENGGGQMIQP